MDRAADTDILEPQRRFAGVYPPDNVLPFGNPAACNTAGWILPICPMAQTLVFLPGFPVE
jgi:hypothetical protein